MSPDALPPVQTNNRVLKEVGGRPASEPWMIGHPDLVQALGIANLDAGQAVAGARGYYLLGTGVLLNQVGSGPELAKGSLLFHHVALLFLLTVLLVRPVKGAYPLLTPVPVGSRLRAGPDAVFHDT